MTIRTDFGEGWMLRAADPDDPAIPMQVRAGLPVPATVPGTVHTDLLAAGLIPDPYLDDAESQLRWIGSVDWVYERPYEHVPNAGEECVLAFDGLDTVAAISVNDRVVARTENMHRRYEVPITSDLHDGLNHIAVTFTAPRVFGEQERARMGELPNQYPGPFNYFRKSACTFGWDWGPDLASSGIWRPVTLIRGVGRRLREVRPILIVDERGGLARFDLDLDRAADAPLSVVATLEGAGAGAGGAEGPTSAAVEVVPGSAATSVEVRVPDPQLWWPRGFGDQADTLATVRLLDVAGEELDRWEHRVAFRSVELDTEPDAEGAPFRLLVNGVAIPVRGVNWIPDDCFFPRVTAERVRQRITQATDAGVNLIRIWGGGTYESDDFYRACDEAGVLVWQDFLFACAAYPEDARLVAEVAAEARDNVARLMPHPSLVIWNGNNENLWGYLDWDWKDDIGDRPWGLGYYFEVLPRAVAELDPTRPYWPGSPYSGSMAIHPNDEEYGLTHIWDVWNQRDYTTYRDHRPRFASEFGWQAPPTWSTMVRAIHDDPLTPSSPGMRAHQKADDGDLKLERGIAAHLPPPRDLGDWHFATQVVQARAVRVGVEHLRALRPRCTGTIVWQLNDCWPVTSWSAVDGDGRRKPMWYALREAYRERLVTIQPRGDGLAVIAVNDTPSRWDEVVTARRISFAGDVLAEQLLTLTVDPLGGFALELPTELAVPASPEREVLVVDTAGGDLGGRAVWFFAEDRDLALDEPTFTLAVERERDDVLMTVTTDALVRDLCLFPDRLAPGAEADAALLTLLPGESAVVRVRGLPQGLEHDLFAPPVLRSVNDLVVGARQAAGSGS